MLSAQKDGCVASLQRSQMRKNEIVAEHYISLSYQLLKKDFFYLI